MEVHIFDFETIYLLTNMLELRKYSLPKPLSILVNIIYEQDYSDVCLVKTDISNYCLLVEYCINLVRSFGKAFLGL